MSPVFDGDSDPLIIGVSLNNLLGITGHTTTISDVVTAAQNAENMGFDAVWLHDAPLGRRTVAAYDTPTLLAAIAAQTERVRLCTGILQPHLRNPVMFGVQWGTLTRLSGNRTILCVATGAGKSRLVDREYQALAALRSGTDIDPAKLYESRRGLFRENIDILRRLWSEDKVSYEGEFYRFEDVTLGEARPEVPPTMLVATGNYYPKERGGPVHHSWNEKWAGRFMPGPYKFVVDYGDGWLTNHATVGELNDIWAKIQDYAQETRPQKQFRRAFNCFVNINDDAQSARAELKSFLNEWHTQVADDVVDRWGIYGPADEVARRIREYIDSGVRIFQLVLASPDQQVQMQRVAEQVLPNLR